MKLLVLTISDENYASAVSSLMWSLCAPSGAVVSTRYMYEWRTHPLTGQVALEIGDGSFFMQPTATPELIIQAVGSALGESDVEELEAAINAQRGSTVEVENLLPSGIAQNVITGAQAEAAGWFPEEGD